MNIYLWYINEISENKGGNVGTNLGKIQISITLWFTPTEDVKFTLDPQLLLHICMTTYVSLAVLSFLLFGVLVKSLLLTNESTVYMQKSKKMSEKSVFYYSSEKCGKSSSICFPVFYYYFESLIIEKIYNRRNYNRL